MANMRAIRSRIKSVQNTQQITKTMKMVAAANLRRTQSGMSGMRAFAEQTQAMLDTLLSGGGTFDAPLLTPRDTVKRVCYVLFVGNRGLCGTYNNALLRFLQQIGIIFLPVNHAEIVVDDLLRFFHGQVLPVDIFHILLGEESSQRLLEFGVEGIIGIQGIFKGHRHIGFVQGSDGGISHTAPGTV